MEHNLQLTLYTDQALTLVCIVDTTRKLVVK